MGSSMVPVLYRIIKRKRDQLMIALIVLSKPRLRNSDVFAFTSHRRQQQRIHCAIPATISNVLSGITRLSSTP
ncbi:hypothetical protein KCP76_19125 [Salmonella enterica subsp. enterica serovar Weltevreden]|nr:hypothetical protein KCP76_19125 [Salmonella enterica subsp. enterica serovar Weltevreden]